ncbi:hypothetical protein H490_0103305 [Leucobacter sp. UCD-THU]|uniref:DUF7927 domain-containing protein n=1 Tax=Leucobacter sp. UCD-THU TaxID=1292023 RepID=UPI00035D386B|nr:DUF11 domain-containing protein [Leucobacter sp. UCD-THU]EYT56245.1 hypothetical protein H490_0103305 [Leucobacter sp. UCD-THU]
MTALALSLAVAGSGMSLLLTTEPAWAEDAQAQIERPAVDTPSAAEPSADAVAPAGGESAEDVTAAPGVTPFALAGMCEANTYYTMDRLAAAGTGVSVKKATYNDDGTINPELTPIDGAQPLDVAGLGGTADVNGNAAPNTHYLNALGVAENGDVWFIDQRGIYGQAGVSNPMVDVYHYSEGHDGLAPLHLAFPAMSLNSPTGGYVVGGGVDQMSGHYYFGYFSDTPAEDKPAGQETRRLHLYRAVVSTLGQMEPDAGEVVHVDFPVDERFSDSYMQLNGDLAFDSDGNLQMVIADNDGNAQRVQVNRGLFADEPGRQTGRVFPDGSTDGARGSASDPLKVPTRIVGQSFVTVADDSAPAMNGIAFTHDGQLITQRGSINVMRDANDFIPLGVPATMSPVSGDLVDLASCFSPDIAIPQPGFELTKSADPASGTAVQAGDRVVYTVTGTNTGSTVLDPAEIADDLSKVLDSASYEADSLTATVITADDARIDATSAAQLDDDQLAWAGVLQPGDLVEISYAVIVNEGVEGETLENRVSASGTPPGLPPIEPPAVITEHPVPGFVISKGADPAADTEVAPGQTITYTVTGTNAGATMLDPATLTDDLSEVVAHAAYNDDAAADIDGDPVVAPTRTDDTLVWTGAMQPGETVTITYSVTVNADASDVSIHNLLTGIATPQTPDPENPTGPPIPGEPIVPPQEETEHPVPPAVDPRPSFDVTKTADPAPGTKVQPGETIAYTLTGVNTGDTVLDPVNIVDDLSGVLKYAEYRGDATATVSGAAAAAPVRNGDTLTWTGALPPGATVTITYSVTVDRGAAGQTLRNVVTGDATPPSGSRITPPPGATEHPVDPTAPAPQNPGAGKSLASTGDWLMPLVGGAAAALLAAGATLLGIRRFKRV